MMGRLHGKRREAGVLLPTTTMKAFINRINRGLRSDADKYKDKDRERSDRDREKVLPPAPAKVRPDDSWLKHASAPPASFSLPPIASTPPLPPPTPPLSAPLPAPVVQQIPPQMPTQQPAQLPTPTQQPQPHPQPTSSHPTTPVERQPSPPPPATHSTASSRPSQQSDNTPDSAARRKVAFRSPPPTPGTPTVALPDTDSTPRVASPVATPTQTTSTTYYKMRPASAAARFAAQHRASPDDPRNGGTTPPRANTSNSRHNTGRTTQSPTSSARLPAQDTASMTIRSGTPYSHMSGLSAIQAAASWSEAAEHDLVNNLGPRERTRQEVLWEIVASEER